MAFGSMDDNQGEVMSEINMTPLVDVMLVLLIIFIITVPVLTHSVTVELPQASQQKTELQPHSVALSIDADGHIRWNEQPLTLAELKQRLQLAAGDTPQPDIHIHGDRRAAYDHVLQVMAAVQQSGISKLGFVTDPGDS